MPSRIILTPRAISSRSTLGASSFDSSSPSSENFVLILLPITLQLQKSYTRGLFDQMKRDASTQRGSATLLVFRHGLDDPFIQASNFNINQAKIRLDFQHLALKKAPPDFIVTNAQRR